MVLLYWLFMHKINGVFSAALTPINQDCSINYQLFLFHCQWLLTQGLDGLGVFGTTGEANAFNVEEKINAQTELTRNIETSPKNTTLYFNILLKSKDIYKIKVQTGSVLWSRNTADS